MPERILRKPAPTKKHRSKRPFLSFLLVLILLAGLLFGYAAIKPLPKLRIITQPVTVAGTAAQPITWPDYGEAAVATGNSNILTTHGQQTPLATASIAKVMTALAVLQRKPLQSGEAGPLITISQQDADSYNQYVAAGGSVVPVDVGETISEYQALQAMLLPSANNMADTLAHWAFGSVDAYLNYANSYANKQGWDSLHLADASGLSDDTVGSASDLTKLGQQALANPVIASIVSQPSADIPIAGTVYNVNDILGNEGVFGIKTGNNDADPGAFLFAAKQSVGDQTLIVVGTVLGAPDLRSAMLDSLPLIRSTAGNFKVVTLATAGQIVGSLAAPWQSSNIILSKNLAATRWNGQAQAATITLDRLSLPVKQNQVVGTISIRSATGQTNSVDLFAAHDIKKPSFWWRLSHIFSD